MPYNINTASTTKCDSEGDPTMVDSDHEQRHEDAETSRTAPGKIEVNAAESCISSCCGNSEETAPSHVTRESRSELPDVSDSRSSTALPNTRSVMAATKEECGRSNRAPPASRDNQDTEDVFPDFRIVKATPVGSNERFVNPQNDLYRDMGLVAGTARADGCKNNLGTCCSNSTDTSHEADSDACNKDCCDSSPRVLPGNSNESACRSSKPVGAQKDENDQIIHQSSNAVTTDDCCKGKQAPCCDEGCVDRLAARACDSECTSTNGHPHPRLSRSATPAAATECCPNGVTARRFYLDLLKRLGCLCRTVKARGMRSCCVAKSQTSSSSKRNVHQAGMPNYSSNKKEACVRECCARRPNTYRTSNKSPGKSTVYRPQSPVPKNLEDGTVESSHVVLSVSGMTCVGCETKLQKSLATIDAVRNLKTSLVLCRAEFDLDLRYHSVDEVIHQLLRMTEFKYEKLEQAGSEVEVRPPDVQALVQQDLPVGVSSMEAVDKTTVRICYDPDVVGARDLLEKKFGSVLPIAPPKPDPSLAAGSKHVWHVGLTTLLSAILTIPVLVLAWAPLRDRPIEYGTISLVLATLVQFLIAGPFYPTALKSLIFAKMIEMDLLIVISTSAAYIFSVVAFAYVVTGKPLATKGFSETSTLLVTLIMFGRWVSALARQRAVESVSVRSLQTPTAILINEADQSEKEIDARLLQYGDLFRVPPESRIPTDGTVVAGTSEVDESMITGESLPVEKQPGATVVAGSINGSGLLTIRLIRLPGNNTISAIANMVDEAKLSKPEIQAVADRIASYFVPAAIALAILTFIVWTPIGLKVRHHDSSRAVTDALTYAITVIIVSCPCAIGLAVPMVIVVAGGVAAKHGCIFKTATTIEIAHKTTHVVFDKTGTLTQGKLSVVTERYFVSQSRVTAALRALLSDIKHPVSLAIKKHIKGSADSRDFKETGDYLFQISGITSYIGKGIEGSLGDINVKAGNSRWLGLNTHPEVQDFLSQGLTTVCVTFDGQLVAVYGLEDSLRSDANRTITHLHRQGIAVSIVSGDDEGPVSAVARKLQITTTRSRCTPADKQHYIKDLNEAGNVTIFCGDGTNDALALAQANIGVHMNEGTDVAQSAADVVLVRSSLIGLLTLVDLSKASMRRVTFNFTWSFIYNVLAILFASGALVNVRIPPQYAGLGELVSVLPVIAIAVQLRWARFTTHSTIE